MDPNYKPLYKQAVDLQYKFRDLLDQPQNTLSRSLCDSIQCLVDDMEKSTNPRTLENRVQKIQAELKTLRAQGDQAMDYEHIDYLHRCYEQLRMSIRKLPNY